MKALLSINPGGPETLELTEVAPPEPGPGELRVRVLACAINYPDTLTILDRYQVRPARPFAPGCELCGEVEAVGSDVTDWFPGDRLIAIGTHGGLAEQALVDAALAIRAPRSADPIQSAALVFTYGTTLHALKDRGGLKSGETLLVLGAAGGVGLAAIELGKVLGARVVAAVSNEAKAAAAREAGADEVVIYGAGPFDKDGRADLARSFKAAVGAKGADVIYDPVGGDYAEAALRAIAWEGRYLVIGFPAGIPQIALNLLLLKSCDVRGVFWGAFVQREPERNAQNIAQLLEWWRQGLITPRVDRTYPLAQGGEAIARLANRQAIGKVIVTPT